MGSDWEARAGVGTMRETSRLVTLRHERQAEMFHNLGDWRAPRAQKPMGRESWFGGRPAHLTAKKYENLADVQVTPQARGLLKILGSWIAGFYPLSRRYQDRDEIRFSRAFSIV